jgi:hypothetical protein
MVLVDFGRCLFCFHMMLQGCQKKNHPTLSIKKGGGLADLLYLSMQARAEGSSSACLRPSSEFSLFNQT